MEWTITRLIQWTSDYFSEKGLATPRLDAEVLLAHVLGLDRLRLYVNFDKPVEPEERQRYREMVRRRANREPVAYITGKKEFFSLEFIVDRSVLIPRPDTELLVEECLKAAASMIEAGAFPRILDIGTGSGAIILAVAANVAHVELFGLDTDSTALELARRNARKLGLSDRVTFLQADLFPSELPDNAPYDIIVSNPPYIPSAVIETLEPDIKLFEPHHALDGGPDGLAFYRKILDGSFKNLTKVGILMLEVDDVVAADVRTMIEQTEQFGNVDCLNDLAGHQRIVTANRENR